MAEFLDKDGLSYFWGKIKSAMPSNLSELSDDSTHRLTTDTEKAKWNATSVFKELTTENLNDVKTVGFYVGKAGNTCANKPSGVVQFGLQVVKLATDAIYYKQILTHPTSNPGDEYVRTCVAGTWGEWSKRVDFSGSYNDLTNKPTIPTVNNASLIIQKNGTTVSTFTANASSNVTANITVPQKTSELVNDSGFITDISGKVSKSGDTMTGELLSADRSMRIQNITAARVFSVEAASGGRVQLHYATSGNHGIYSYGYGDSLSDTTTFTSSPQWIIGRNAEGAVFISNWVSKGNYLTPTYFNSSGMPAASSGKVIPYIVGTGTVAGTWTGTLSGLTAYYDGLLILYKTPVAGATTTTLNLNSLGAKTIYTSGTTKLTTHFPANQPMLLVYSTDTDNGCWKAVDFYNSDTRPQAQCNTAAATAAKVADMTYFTATDKSYLMVNIRYANTSASKITLNVNSTGAKDIYINGTVSSSTNYTLPAGSYLVYYSNSKYYFRTDGKITGDITGNATTVGGYTVAANVPSGAVFTDEKVKITNDTTSSNLRVLLGTSQNDSTVTESIKKSTALNFNPSTGVFYSPRIVIRSSDGNAPFIVDTEDRSTIPSNGDDIGIFNGAYKKTVSGTTTTQYNSIISLIGNNDTQNVNVVRFGSSSGATIITGGAGAKAFPKNFINDDGSIGKYSSNGAIWLAAESEVHVYTNASDSAAKFGGHIKMNAGGITVERTDSSVGTTANAYIMLGNDKASSTTKGASKGIVRFYNQNSAGTDTFYVNLDTNTLSANRTIHLPNGDGTLQLQSTMSVTELTTGTATTSRTMRADTLKSGIQQIVDERHLWREIASTTSGSSFTFDMYDYFSGAKFPELFIECNTVADRCYVTAGSHGSGTMYTFSFELNAVGNVKPIKLDTTGRSSYIEPVGGDCLSGYGIFDEVRITALEGYTNLEVHVYMRS